jgi:outer membrane lipoprotein carrier protein
MMSPWILAALLLPAGAGAAPAKPAPAAAPAVAASTASAGTALPLYAASTAPVTLDLIAARFAELDARMNALRADFKQFARMEGSDAVQQVEGQVLFKKPEFMRLTHRLPEPQIIVADGTWLWVYRLSTNQVIQTKLEDWRRSEPLAKGLLDFGRSADLLKRYESAISTVSASDADGYRTFVVALTPKPADVKAGGADFTLTLKASTRDYFPYEASLKVGHASIRSVFENVRLNPPLPDSAFHFTPPSDADVFQTPGQQKP